VVAGAALDSKLREALEALPKGLHDHILRVEEEADRLARRHGVDRERSRLSALGHDLVRHLTGPELLAMAERYGIQPLPVEVDAPVLVHGPVAARILAIDFGVEDAELLAGVDCHTTARANMGPVEKVLFVADKVEPHKLKRRDELKQVRHLADDDLDAGILRYLDLLLEDAMRHRWQLHPRVIEARNQLLVASSLTLGQGDEQ
jgi:predicted HD superfamily hydrolase involved in NAD metabolism